MKNLNQYVIERLRINKDISPIKYKYHPKKYGTLLFLLHKLIEERGPDADLNDIDITELNDISYLFKNIDPHNINISKWDVRNIGNMHGMFWGCKNFNCDLSNWDVRNVKNMGNMFHNCENFNCDLSKWKPINVWNMNAMFDGCKSLKNKPSWYKE